LDRRYNDTAILIFGDFNYRRDLIESKFSSLVRRGFKIIFDSNPEQYTRSQDTIKGTPRSYIDYFIIKNLRDFDLTINEPIGRSDHRAIGLDVLDNVLRIKRNTSLEFTFSKVKKQASKIGTKLLEGLKLPNPAGSFVSLVNDLSRENPPRAIVVRSHFKVIEKLNKLKDWEAVAKVLKNSSYQDFELYMSCLEKLRASRKDKEYFVRFRFYSDLNKNVDILSDLLIDDAIWGKIVTTDKDIINDRVTHKYKELFRDTGNKNRI